MWVFVSKILHALVSLGLMAGQQIKAAWVQCRALAMAGAVLAIRHWSARLAWRVSVAVLFVSLIAIATSAIQAYVVPDMSSLLDWFAPRSATANREGVYYLFWDTGLNLRAFFAMLRKVVTALVSAWSCRKLWAVFLSRKLFNPPM